MSDNSELIVGTDGDDTIDAGGGRDWVTAGGGDDTVRGGDDGDIIRGGSGDDELYGDGGNDVIRGDSGDDEIYGGSGNDTLLGDAGADTIDGGSGNDFIAGGAGNDTLTGGSGADTFVFGGSSGDDTITDFNVAEDTIDLTMLSEQIGYADLTITDVTGGVTITHTAIGGTITLTGVTAAQLSAGNFNFPDADPPDAVETDAATIVPASDPWNGTDNGETLIDNAGDTTINAMGGNDIVMGGEGNDTIDGGAGNDLLLGEEGDDTITGGAGDDVLIGGSGEDTFVFAAGHGEDTIMDFTNGTDTIDLGAFTGISQYSDVSDNATQVGDDVVIDLSSFGGGTITIENFALSDLDATDFSL